MPLFTGSSGIRLISDDGSYPRWQADHEISISKTVDGSLLTVGCKRAPTGVSYKFGDPTQITEFYWNSTQFCAAFNAGAGIGSNYYICSAAASAFQQWAPTEPGNTDDALPDSLTSNVLAQGLNDADGTGMTRIYMPAFWLKPGESQIANSGNYAFNKRELAETLTTSVMQIGLAGNDHIVTFEQTIVVPEDPVVQAATVMSFIPLYHTCPNFDAAPSFEVQEWVDFVTGTARDYTAGQTSTTEVLMCRKTDGSAAMACVYGSGTLGDSGYYKGRAGGTTFGYTVSYGWPIKDYPGGVPAGTAYMPTGLCYGTRDDLVGSSGAIVHAFANLPSAIYP